MLANLRSLFGVVVDIILLRRGPEQLPTSSALLVAVILVFAAATTAVASQVADPELNWPLVLVTGMVMTLAWYHAALRLARKRERFVQTMTAMFAARAVFVPALIPLSAIISTHRNDTAPDAATTALALLALLLSLWQFAIEVRIVRSAFEWHIPGAIALVLAQEFFTIVVFVSLFGGAAPPG